MSNAVDKQNLLRLAHACVRSTLTIARRTLAVADATIADGEAAMAIVDRTNGMARAAVKFRLALAARFSQTHLIRPGYGFSMTSGHYRLGFHPENIYG